jgi:hypothetical protein
MNDIDLLVMPEDLKNAVSCLLAQGYTLTKRYSDVATLRKDVGFEVEVHTHPFSRLFYGDGAGHFFENSVKLRIGNFEFAAPCREDLFLELCVHLYMHLNYYRQNVPERWLRELRDACLVLGPLLDREHVSRDIRAYRLSRAVGAGLAAAQAQIPEGIFAPPEHGLHRTLVALCESPHVPKLGGLFAALSALLYGNLDTHKKLLLLREALRSGAPSSH